MEDLIVQISKINAKPDDIILITLGKEYDFDDCNTIIKSLAKSFPDFQFAANREGLIKNITIIEKDELLYPTFSEGECLPL